MIFILLKYKQEERKELTLLQMKTDGLLWENMSIFRSCLTDSELWTRLSMLDKHTDVSQSPEVGSVKLCQEVTFLLCKCLKNRVIGLEMSCDSLRNTLRESNSLLIVSKMSYKLSSNGFRKVL